MARQLGIHGSRVNACHAFFSPSTPLTPVARGRNRDSKPAAFVGPGGGEGRKGQASRPPPLSLFSNHSMFFPRQFRDLRGFIHGECSVLHAADKSRGGRPRESCGGCNISKREGLCAGFGLEQRPEAPRRVASSASLPLSLFLLFGELACRQPERPWLALSLTCAWLSPPSTVGYLAQQGESAREEGHTMSRESHWSPSFVMKSPCSVRFLILRSIG
ncbi:hypothetical protein LX36DRAFT_237090 [Colletotrichum falcatum]|nr:hypothetical protein LX36DRAFT_237090 [Colletotrichum falcatum]